MKTSFKLLAGTAGIACTALGASGALASGVTQGTTISNTASVAYSVGGVAQTPATGTVAFLVDRKVTVAVAEVGTTTTSVTPGQATAVTTFTVTNSSNATIDIGLTAVQLATGTATVRSPVGPPAITDGFDLSPFSLFVDTNSNGTYDAGTDTAVTYLDELVADASRTIFAVGSVPLSAANGQYAGVQLVGVAREGGGTGSQGLAITATGGANTAAVDTVLLDAAGPATGDTANDGEASDDDDYVVSSAALTVTKTSVIISDPVSGTGANRKNIPGAVIEYCIAVSNTGSAAATAVTVSDNVPVTLTYNTGTTFLNATLTGGVCNADGTTTGATYAAGPPEVVGGNLGTVNAGATTALRFRATIK